MVRSRAAAKRTVDALQREIDESGLSLASHLRQAIHELRHLAVSKGVHSAHITGRTKSYKQSIEKLLDTPEESLSGIQGSLAGMDRIGLRLVVNTDAELETLLSALLPNAIHLKDYVAHPRRDGEFLQGDPDDVYRGYHLFTRQLTGIPVEIQMFTVEMRRAGIHLKRKYGNGYWKSKEFRRRRIEAGDIR